MRLEKVTIKNFRKLRDCTIIFRDTTMLIGSNNAGKSSVFAALDYLHKNSNVTREDYSKIYNSEDEDYTFEKEIKIIGEYHNVPVDANNWIGFKGRLIKHKPVLEGESGYKIIYKKVWTLAESKIKISMLEYPRSVNNKYSEAKITSDLVGDDYTEDFIKEHFGSENFEKKFTTAKLKPKLDDLSKYWDIDIDSEADWILNPGGIPGNILSKLPNIVIIPAESCIEELTSSGGALFNLLNILFDNVRTKSENYENAQKFLNALANELDPNDISTDFGSLLKDLNSMTHNLFPDSAVHVTAELDKPEKTIKPQFKVEMESNVKTSVKYQGHGMIRSTVFQLLRFVQDYINHSLDFPKSTIFCFEEPEIYLHPSAANQMRDALYDLSGSNCQIIATTHSPFMVNLGTDIKMSLTKFSIDEDGFSKSKSFNLESAFLELQDDEKQNLKMLLKIDDYISRMFFTRKCIFIEGDTEEIVIRETIKRLNKDDKSRVIGNCEFLRARGKAVLISVAKYLNALDIEYIIMHDRDQKTPKAASINPLILKQTGNKRRIMIEECIEDLLGYKPPTSEKPFKAYNYITENWSDEFENLPLNWRLIFIKLCSPFLDHLI